MQVPSVYEPEAQADPFSVILQYAQLFGVWLVPFLAPNAIVWLAWAPPDAPDAVGIYFKYIIYFLYFPAMALTLFLTLFRAATENDYRKHLFETARQILLRPLGVFWLLLLAWMLAGWLWSISRPLTLYGAVVMLTHVGLALVVADTTRAGKHSGVLTAVMIAAVLQGALAIAQSVNGGPVGLRFIGEPRYDPLLEFGVADATYRATGLAFHPNVMGGFLLMGLFAAIAWTWAVHQRRGLMVIGGFAALVVMGGLLATQSRSAILGLIAAVGLCIFLLPDPRRLPRQMRYLMIGVLVAGVIMVITAGIVAYQMPVPRSIIDRMWLVLQNPMAHTGRLFYAFPPTVAVIEQFTLLGVGANTLMLKAYELMPDYSPVLPAHNVYVVMTAEHGVIGGVLFGLACLMTLGALRFRRRPVAYFIAALFAGVMVVMVFDHYFWWDDRTFVVLMMLLGVMWGVSRQQDVL